jgi:Protein of unknown function (DUF692)
MEVRSGRDVHQHRIAEWQARLAEADLIGRERRKDDGRKAEKQMKSAAKPAAVAAIPLRFPALPVAGLAGTSFKHEHLSAIVAEGGQRGFFEVHAENYMGGGGPPHRALETLRRDHPVSLHGVCMSIGAPQPLDKAHLARFKSLVERYEPALVSEHLAWSTHETTYFNDLLPLPYTQATLELVCEHIDARPNGKAAVRPIIFADHRPVAPRLNGTPFLQRGAIGRDRSVSKRCFQFSSGD